MSTHWTDKLPSFIAELPLIKGAVQNARANAYVNNPDNWQHELLPSSYGRPQTCLSLKGGTSVTPEFKTALFEQMAGLRALPPLDAGKEDIILRVTGEAVHQFANSHPRAMPESYRNSFRNNGVDKEHEWKKKRPHSPASEASTIPNPGTPEMGKVVFSGDMKPGSTGFSTIASPEFEATQQLDPRKFLAAEDALHPRNWKPVTLLGPNNSHSVVLDYVGDNSPTHVTAILRNMGVKTPELALSKSHDPEERLVVRLRPDQLPKSLRHLLTEERKAGAGFLGLFR